MKLSKVLTGTLIGLCISGCIQNEAPNVEAAIDSCKGKGIQLTHINHAKKDITLYVSKYNDIKKQEILFTLSENATIEADIKDTKDTPPYYNFKDYSITNLEQEKYQRGFTVTSESQTIQAQYKINLLTAELPLKYTFDHLAQTSPFHILYDEGNLRNNEAIQWTSGNEGYENCRMAKTAEMYPTIQADNGKRGKCVRLETKSTGSFGKVVHMPIAAGNLFIGAFDAVQALSKPRKATQFGFPFTQVPERLTGYYKFQAGKQMTDQNNQAMAGKDKCDIYAIMYEAEKFDFFLDGDNSLTDASIVLKARIKPEDIKESEEWEFFDLPFEPQNNKAVNSKDLAEGKYKLAIVFSSSVDGAYFKGAVGSTLWIDEVEIICKP